MKLLLLAGALVAYLLAMGCALAALAIDMIVLREAMAAGWLSYAPEGQLLWNFVCFCAAAKLLAEVGRRWTEHAEADG